jgi:hypothetical protein
VKLGKPLARCTSTRTGGAAHPSKDRLITTANDIAAPADVRLLDSGAWG